MKVQFIFPPHAEQILWLCCVGQVKLGIDLKCGWCLQIGARIVALATKGNMIPLLPLLEIERAQFIAHLFGVTKAYPECAAWDFPETILLECAFESSVSDYWPLKALEWLDAEPSLSVKLRDSLRFLMQQRWAGQKLKQRVTKILK